MRLPREACSDQANGKMEKDIVTLGEENDAPFALLSRLTLLPWLAPPYPHEPGLVILYKPRLSSVFLAHGTDALVVCSKVHRCGQAIMDLSGGVPLLYRVASWRALAFQRPVADDRHLLCRRYHHANMWP